VCRVYNLCHYTEDVFTRSFHSSLPNNLCETQQTNFLYHLAKAFVTTDINLKQAFLLHASSLQYMLPLPQSMQPAITNLLPHLVTCWMILDPWMNWFHLISSLAYIGAQPCELVSPIALEQPIIWQFIHITLGQPSSKVCTSLRWVGQLT